MRRLPERGNRLEDKHRTIETDGRLNCTDHCEAKRERRRSVGRLAGDELHVSIVEGIRSERFHRVAHRCWSWRWTSSMSVAVEHEEIAEDE